MKPIGKITHYYGKVGVAILRLEDTLSIGDRIRLEKGETVFDQQVTSMQKDFKDVEKAEKGDEVGVKVDQKISTGALVVRLEEGE